MESSTIAEETFTLHQRAQNFFTEWDYVALALFLAVSLGIGIFTAVLAKFRKSEDTTEEFLMGGRQLKVIPVAISLLVSFNSAILILGGPLEMYFNGTMYSLTVFGEGFGCLIAAFIFVPVFYKIKLTSTFEYLELRFKSYPVRIIGNILTMISAIMYMGIALYAPATALEYVSNKAIPVELSIIVSGLIATVYTGVGGIKAVIWTDVFQAAVMTAGIIAVIIQGSLDLGGMGNIWNIAFNHDRIEFDNTNPDPRERHTIWGLLFGNAVGWSATYGISQASVQRYCGLPTLRKAKISVILNILGAMFFTWLSCLAGITIFAYYASVACDPVEAKWIDDPNQLVTYYMMDRLKIPFVPGIVVASLFAGALSSASSFLSALSATTWEDMLKPALPNLSSFAATNVTRLCVFIFGALGIAVGLVAKYLGGTVLQASLSFTGSFNSPLLGMYILGIMFPYSNKYGAMIGAFFGLIMSALMNIGAYVHGKQIVALPTNITNCELENITLTTTLTSTIPPPTTTIIPQGLDDLFSISYIWFSVIGTGTTVIVGLFVSAIIKDVDAEVDDSLIHPAFNIDKFQRRRRQPKPSADDDDMAMGALSYEQLVSRNSALSEMSEKNGDLTKEPSFRNRAYVEANENTYEEDTDL